MEIYPLQEMMEMLTKEVLAELVGWTLNERYPRDGPVVQMNAVSENPLMCILYTVYNLKRMLR